MITLFNEIKNSEIDTNDLEGWVPISGNPTMKTQILHTNRENKICLLYTSDAADE